MQLILASPVPLVVGAGDVCRQNLALSLKEAVAMLKDRGPIGKWLWTEFQGWYYRFIKPLRQDDFSRPWIIWDNITLAYLMGMASSVTHPRPQLMDDLSFQMSETGQTVSWITDVDEDRMWADFLGKLDRYEATHKLSDCPAMTRLTFGLP